MGSLQLKSIRKAYGSHEVLKGIDLDRHMNDAVQSLRICLAADESVRTGRPVKL